MRSFESQTKLKTVNQWKKDKQWAIVYSNSYITHAFITKKVLSFEL